MKKYGKKYNSVVGLVDAEKIYSVEEACELVKKTSTTKFDATVDVAFRLNVDPTRADQQIRGTLTLPHGNGKTKRVLAITQKIDEALAAGADFAGGKEMIEKIQKENWFDYDIIVASPDMMAELGKIGRVLGPKGLMPNPKSGTVSVEVGKAVTEIKGGKVQYRVDKQGNVALTIGKVSFDAEKLTDNLKTVLDTIIKVRPSVVKGTYIKNLALHTTMGPSIRVSSEKK